MRRPQRFLIPALLLAMPALPAAAEGPKTPSATEVVKLHRMLKPQPGESRWIEIDWHPSVWEARQRAAREGKPIFLMAGSGGAPPAGC